MRSIVALLLLVLALPGLLLPAGIAWHFCRCDERTPPARSCCSAAAAPAAQQVRTCCHGAVAPVTPHDRVPRADDHACGCVLLALPDLQRSLQVPGWHTPAALPAASPTRVLTLAAPGSAPAPRGWRSADTYHPPPGADRNLPLRL